MADDRLGAGCPAAGGTWERLRGQGSLAAVALVALLNFLGRAWEGDLHGDPVHYAALAKNIVASGEWLTLRDAPDLVYAKKPPLMMWLVAANFRFFGANTFTAKVWSCIFAVGVCILVFLTGRRLFGETAGLLGGCSVALMPGMVMNSMDLRLDSAVSLAVAATVYGAVRAVQEGRPRWLFLAGVAGGLGFMTKMSAGVHVPAVLVLVLLASRPRWLLHPCFWGAVALGVAIAAPWHLVVAGRHAESFTGVYFRQEMGERMVFGKHVAGNLVGNAVTLVVLTLPWFALAAYAVARWRRGGPAERWGMLVALLWTAEVLLVTAVPPKRYERYMATAFPAIGLLAGRGLAWLIPRRHHGRVPRVVRVLAALQAFAMVLVPVELHNYRCLGFTQARPMLDALEPGTALAGYWPPEPGKEEREGGGPWGLRAKATYYLDRQVAYYARAEDLAATPTRFAAARERHVADLVKLGFEVAFELDESYRLLMRPAPAGSGAKP